MDTNPLSMLIEEHRMIESFLDLCEQELERLARSSTLDEQFVNAACDFLDTYAQQFHHGKEEIYLFRDLEKRNPDEAHLQLVRELAGDHRLVRQAVNQLIAIRNAWFFNGEESLVRLLGILKDIVAQYRAHMRREEDVCFPLFIQYYSDAEAGELAQSFVEFDQKFLSRKYRNEITRLGRSKS